MATDISCSNEETILIHDVSSGFVFPSNISQLSAYSQDKFIWIPSATEMLIQIVSDNFSTLYDKKLKRKLMWLNVAEKMKNAGSYCTSKDCEKKWKSLKKTYVDVLQKEVKGDFSSKFEYFDKLHTFLGREIDPFGMRDKRMKGPVLSSQNHRNQSSMFFELTEDSSFIWSDNATYSLLNLIIEHRTIFSTKGVTGGSVWESIVERMLEKHYEVNIDKCLRKWQNLTEGYRYYQEKSSPSSSWKFYPELHQISSAFVVPTTIVRYSPVEELSIRSIRESISLFRAKLINDEGRNLLSFSTSIHKSLSINQFLAECGPSSSTPSDPSKRSFHCHRYSTKLQCHLNNVLSSFNKSFDFSLQLNHLENRVKEVEKREIESKNMTSRLNNLLVELTKVNGELDRRKGLESSQQKEEFSDSFSCSGSNKLLSFNSSDCSSKFDYGLLGKATFCEEGSIELDCIRAVANGTNAHVDDLSAFNHFDDSRITKADEDCIIIANGGV